MQLSKDIFMRLLFVKKKSRDMASQSRLKQC